MRISRLVLSNYRCFKDFVLDLPGDFTILVGNNGSGKSTVLDGMAVGLASFFLGMGGASTGNIQKSDVRTESYELGSRIEKRVQYPSRIECKGTITDNEITWARALNTEKGNTTYGEARELTQAAADMKQRIHASDASVILPILSYYGTGRLWAKKREKRETASVDLNSRFAGYADCLDAMTNDKIMHKWFEQMTYLELQEKKPIPELEAVKKAVLECFNNSGNLGINGNATRCRYNVKNHEIEVTYETKDGQFEVHALSQMSDGYRNMLSMVADIAYRMALLNPQLLDCVTQKTDGVVLIDEIDLHLHPAWQRHIVGTLKSIFPKVQFIVSTHAPSVIASAKQDEVVILKDYAPLAAPFLTYGKDANAILNTVMDVPERQDDVKEEITKFHAALAAGSIETARISLGKLVTVLGEDDPEVVGAETALALETME